MCLQSLRDTSGSPPVKTVVVDNASSDGTPEMVRSEFPTVALHVSEHNLGFAAANNLAMREAQTGYVLLLNPDTVVLTPGLGPLVRFLEAHTKAWAVGPRLLNSDRTPQRTGVRFPSVWNIAVESFFLDRLFPNSRVFGRHRELYLQEDEPRRVDYVQGSCLMIRRELVVNRVGLLDEGYFMYFEETDWCYRLYHAGGEVWICPEARVVHRGGGETGHFDERRIVYYHQSLFRYLRRNAAIISRVFVRVVIVVRSILRMAAWGMVAAAKPPIRAKAVSAIRGYSRVFLLCFRPASH